MGLFCAENVMVGSQDPERMQGALKVLIGLFHQYILVVNVAKSKAVTFHTGTPRYSMLKDVVRRR